MLIRVSKSNIQSITKKFSRSRKELGIKSIKMTEGFELVSVTIDNRKWSPLLASFLDNPQPQLFNCSIQRFNKWFDEHPECQHPELKYDLLAMHLVTFLEK